MDTKKINVQIVEENRAVLADASKVYGKRIYKAVKNPVILDFASRAEQANHTKDLFLNRNINRYKTVFIDITSIALRKGIDEDYEIVLNEGQIDEAGNDIEIRCPLTKAEFTTEVTVENLAEALNKNDSSNMFFSSGKKLAKFLNAENDKELLRIDSLLKELEQAKKTIVTTKENNINGAESYYRQLDGKKDINIHVSVNE